MIRVLEQTKRVVIHSSSYLISFRTIQARRKVHIVEILTGNYGTIQELNDAVFAKFRKYLVKGNVKEKRANFILTYMEEFENAPNKPINERLLDDINIIMKRVRIMENRNAELLLQKIVE